MTDRAALADRFIASTDWADAARGPLAGDASNRKYERMVMNAASAVFMDAPPDKGEDVRPFVRIARYLRDLGLSAPDILAEDAEHGFLILEDLGDDLFARVIPKSPTIEDTLYRAATNALIHLHAAPPPALETYDAARMSDLAALAFHKYQTGALGVAASPEAAAFTRRFEDCLLQHVRGALVLIQRDYHAENLLWLPERDGVARVGLLDFQDAMLGHPAYDLVSLLQDVRREVSASVEAAMITHYIAQTGQDNHAFRTAYAVLGAQRNLRILGVFARLATEYGKPHYVDLIPAVWAHVMRDLEHPALAGISDLVHGALPEPTAQVLDRLKSK
ncbi:MAG: aminoglycoside phosphotransferase family protein [Sedimentitalea sp.]